MSELRNRSLVPPPPRHPAAVRPPSPNLQPRSHFLKTPPPPVHPSLPPRPTPSPRPDARLEYFSAEPISSEVAAPSDVLHIPRIQRLSPPVPQNYPGSSHPFSGNNPEFTLRGDAPPAVSPVLPQKHPDISPELLPPASPTNSIDSIIGSSTIPPPIHHARKAHSLSSDSIYEANLSEKELRDLYDDEEIDRFLRLFSAFVNEVKLNDGSQTNTSVEFAPAAEGLVIEDPEDNDDRDWVSLNDVSESFDLPHDVGQPQTISEQIAQKFIAPYLPKTKGTIPPFTVLRFRLTVQRLYLALEPGCQYIVDNLVSLALWENKSRSLIFCLGYWVLWLHDLLLPSFVFYLLYILLHRRMYPYPSLAQLREHRGHIDKASEFGEELQARLTATTPFGLFDAWKTLRVYNKSKVLRAKEKMKLFDDAASVMSTETTATDGDITATDDLAERTHEQGIKALWLEALSQIVDGLERVKNLFLWRKPTASRIFSIVLGVVAFATLLLPTEWLAKIVYLMLGIAFWHIPPILAALPAGDHRRVLALLQTVPTDVDYTMELIAERIARGQEIKPLNRKRKSSKESEVPGSSDVRSHGSHENSKSSGFLKQGVSALKTVADTGYQAIGGQRFIHNNFAPAAVRNSGPQGNVRSYPAQRGKVPGVITVSAETFYFTPLLSGPKLEIPVEDIVGIKKASPKGISIRVRDGSQEGGERKEKFMLVYERDELFGRLVGTGGKKWTRI